MKKQAKLQKIKNKFYWSKGKNWDECRGEPELSSFGEYRLGLTSEEINDYLSARGNTLSIKNLRKKFSDIAGCNTCAMNSKGECLMYRHDIQRFVDVLFKKTKATYFD